MEPLLGTWPGLPVRPGVGSASTPITGIARALQQGVSQREWQVTVISSEPLSARLVATDTNGAAMRSRRP
ncbi:hypothetical protein [Streptomyces sp. NPDC101150]|uniref:hypothetical protein n=1 Tax=Streptomyces sp. NPDC101150 TaxID=3366114 RepID=UPI0037FC2FEA